MTDDRTARQKLRDERSAAARESALFIDRFLRERAGKPEPKLVPLHEATVEDHLARIAGDVVFVEIDNTTD